MKEYLSRFSLLEGSFHKENILCQTSECLTLFKGGCDNFSSKYFALDHKA